jgi:class 3 adenylate cyclase
MGYESVLLSVDCLASLFFYIVPKIMSNSKGEDASEADPDLFVDTTIMIADISGFAAWSSVREPVQVFKFLELIYSSFDKIADKRKVFKVETSGDCYGKDA